MIDTVLISLTIACLFIGLHQTWTVGLTQGYWLLMMMVVFLMLFQIRRSKRLEREKNKQHEIPEDSKVKGRKTYK